MNHISIKKDSDCYGCRGCLNICPKHAIVMLENKEGFLYPVVNEDKCIDCGLCLKVCPVRNHLVNKWKLKNPMCYAAKIKDKDIQRQSSSGGMFSVIANYVLDQEGLVYGSEMTDDHLVHHIEIKEKSDLDKIRGSKYVYSDLENIFSQVKNNLIKDRMVLFSGVPCQIAALKLFLKKDYDNLITVDVICHGTPNQKLFDKYINFLEKKSKLKILNYQFRSKKYVDWGNWVANIVCSKSNKIVNKKIEARFDWYYDAFLKSKNYRESCYTCQYASNERISDITLGDFWGITKVSREFYDSNGVSAVILSTKNGQKIFNKIYENIDVLPVSFEEISRYNEQLRCPVDRPKERDNWYNNFNSCDFADKKHSEMSYKLSIKRFIPYKIQKFMKIFLNRV